MYSVLPKGTDLNIFKEMAEKHFNEVEKKSENILFSLDTNILQGLFDQDLLVIVVAISDKDYIGYYASLISKDFMSDGLIAKELAIYVDEDCRSKGICEGLFKAVEEELKSRKVEVNYTGFKAEHNETYPIKLGYKVSEIIYEKVLN